MPRDVRFGAIRGVNSEFPFVPAESPEDWFDRAEFVRRRILVAAGLWPKPNPVKIVPTYGDRVERDEYTVTPIRFESMPGNFVTGSLYEPTNRSIKKSPGMLCPHGHWKNGRFHQHREERIQGELENSAEFFEVGGRYPLQARCVQLVRMGFVVFHYDMLGYADSAPLARERAHQHVEGLLDENEEPDRWGLYSAQACLRLISPFGIQTLNSIRALDWLCSLPNIDRQRIGMTGASGGGTQTFILSAIDSRVAAAFPAAMVSTTMQGGCTCENAPLLRIDTGNVEFAALTAPRPLGLTAANDWTRGMPDMGFPQLHRHYEMLGVSDHFRGEHFDFGHNYNAVSRAYMYEFFNAAFDLGLETPIVERDYEPLRVEEMTAWPDQEQKPQPSIEAERSMLHTLAEDQQRRIESLIPTNNPTSFEAYRCVIGGAVSVMVAREMPDVDDVQCEKTGERVGSGHLQITSTWSLKKSATHGAGERVSGVTFQPEARRGPAVIWFHGRGLSELYASDGQPIPPIRQLLDGGVCVTSADLFTADQSAKNALPTPVGCESAQAETSLAISLGYNHSLFARRVHDVLTLLSFITRHGQKPLSVSLVGTGGAGPVVAAAAVIARDSIDQLAVDTEGFRFKTLTDWRDPNIWPGAVHYGDVPALLALTAPRPIWIAGEKAVPDIVTRCYAAAGAGARITRFDGEPDDVPDAAVKWLLRGTDSP